MKNNKMLVLLSTLLLVSCNTVENEMSDDQLSDLNSSTEEVSSSEDVTDSLPEESVPSAESSEVSEDEGPKQNELFDV